MRCFAPSTKSQTIDLKIGGGGGEVEVLEAEKSYVAKLASGGALASKWLTFLQAFIPKSRWYVITTPTNRDLGPRSMQLSHIHAAKMLVHIHT